MLDSKPKKFIESKDSNKIAILRQSLLQMTEEKRLLEHPSYIEKLRIDIGHSITILDSEHPVDEYTCAVCAFHLVAQPNYDMISEVENRSIFAGADFIHFLLENKLLIARNDFEIQPGDLIIYFNNGKFQHIGRMKTQNRVLSKWGLGHLYAHDIYEVPASYGDEVHYFVGPNKEESLNLFFQYVREKARSLSPLNAAALLEFLH